MKLSDLVKKIKYLEIKHGADFEIRKLLIILKRWEKTISL